MSNRATLTLAVIAVALFSFIVLVERDTLSTGEVEGRSARILPRFSRHRVTRVEIEQAEGGRLAIEHRTALAEAGDEEDPGEWWMLEPTETRADEEAVQTLLGLLEYSDSRRRIPDLTEEDRGRFGLDSPRLRLILEVATERMELRVGGEDPTGGGHYAWLVGADEGLIIGLDVVEGIGREANTFRSRSVFPAGLVGLEALSLVDAEGSRRVEKREGRWWLEEPTRMYASEARVRDLMRQLIDLEVATFDPELAGPSDPFAEAFLSIDIHLGGAREESVDHRLRVGGGCASEGGEETRFARLDDGDVFCVEEGALAALSVDADALRDMRPLTTEEVDVEGLEFSGRGATVSVSSDGEAWTFTASGAAGDAQGGVDADALSEWLQTARRARALGVRPATDANLEEAGLSSPRAVLTLDRRADAPDEVLRIGRVVGESLLVRRDDEGVILELPAEAARALELSPLMLRGRILIHENEEALVRLSVERASDEGERVLREGGRFWIEAPARAPADRVVVRDVASRLAALSALSFVAASATPAHGLAAPRFVLGFAFQGALPDEGEGEAGDEERAHRLVIGSETEGGAFARLDDDPAVFVLPLALVELIRAPLISRDLLSTQALHLDRLEIEAGGATLILRDEGEGLADAAGDLEAGAIAERVQPLATLRASSIVGYSSGASAHGFESPRARISVERDSAAGDPASYVLVVGGSDGQGGVYVRREDLPAVFVVPGPSVNRLLGGSL